MNVIELALQRWGPKPVVKESLTADGRVRKGRIESWSRKRLSDIRQAPGMPIPAQGVAQDAPDAPAPESQPTPIQKETFNRQILAKRKRAYTSLLDSENSRQAREALYSPKKPSVTDRQLERMRAEERRIVEAAEMAMARRSRRPEVPGSFHQVFYDL